MSDLREALRALSNPDGFPLFSHSQVDSVLLVFEAYLREHDAQTRSDWPRMLTNAQVEAYNRGQAAERERIRQRIEALPGVITGMEYVHGVREGNPAIVMRAAVLEALGGSDG